MTKVLIRLWFIRGFEDTRQGKIWPSNATDGRLDALDAWNAGRDHFLALVRAESDRIGKMLADGSADGFPYEPGSESSDAR